jgi:hypothetical protein
MLSRMRASRDADNPPPLIVGSFRPIMLEFDPAVACVARAGAAADATNAADATAPVNTLRRSGMSISPFTASRRYFGNRAK